MSTPKHLTAAISRAARRSSGLTRAASVRRITEPSKQWHELTREQRDEVRDYIRDELQFWKGEKDGFGAQFYEALKAALGKLKKVKRA